MWTCVQATLLTATFIWCWSGPWSRRSGSGYVSWGARMNVWSGFEGWEEPSWSMQVGRYSLPEYHIHKRQSSRSCLLLRLPKCRITLSCFL